MQSESVCANHLRLYDKLPKDCFKLSTFQHSHFSGSRAHSLTHIHTHTHTNTAHTHTHTHTFPLSCRPVRSVPCHYCSLDVVSGWHTGLSLLSFYGCFHSLVPVLILPSLPLSSLSYPSLILPLPSLLS